MAKKTTVAELDINTEAFLKAATETKGVLDSLKASQTALRKNGEQSSEQFVKQEVTIKRLSAQYTQQKNVLVSLNTVNQDYATVQKSINKAVDKNITTIAAARDNNKELLKVRNELNLSTDKGKKELIKINSKLDENNKFIKENVSGYEQQKINIGNYEGALKSVFPQLSGMIDGLKSATIGLQTQKAAMQAATTTTTASSKALRIFKIALASTGIGLLLIALGSLVTFLTSTQKGMDAVTKVTRPLQAIFSSLIGVVENLGEKLFNAFSNPKQLLNDLISFLEGQVMNRFKSLGVILEGIINLDFKKIADGVLQGATGVENLISKTQKAGEETAKFLTEAAAKGKEIDNLQKSIERSEIALTKSRAESMRIIKEQNKIAEDVNKTLSEREAGARKPINERLKIQKDEQAIIDLKIAKMKIEQSLNDTNREDEKELAELQAQRADSETRQLEMATTLTNKLNTIKKEQAGKDKAIADENLKQEEAASAKRVEIAVAVANRELEIFQRTHQSKLDSNTFFNDELLAQEMERLAQLEQAEKDHQTKLLEQGKVSKLEYNQAIEDIEFENRKKIAEAELLREESKKEKEAIDLDNKRIIDEETFLTDYEIQAERNEIVREQELANAEKTGADTQLINNKFDAFRNKIDKENARQKLQITAQTLGGIASLLGENSKAGKAAGAAQALINTYQGITAELATKAITPFEIGLKIANVATVAGLGFKAVKNITSTKTPSFYEGGQVPTGTGGVISGQNIPTQKGGDNVLAFVKSGEVILNKQQQARAGGSEFFKSIGVPSFNTGGFVGSSQIKSSINESFDSDRFTEAISEKINDVKVVAIVDEINNGQANKAEIIDGANI